MSSIPFDAIAADYDRTRGGLVRGGGFARSLADVLGPIDGVVLDVGVGTGAVALPLRELGYEVVGVDLSTPMLRQAVERLGPSVVQGDALRLPVRTDAMGAAVLCWVLQLVPDAAAVLAECRRAVRPGGRVGVVVAQPIEHVETDIRPLELALGARLHQVPVEQRAAEARAAGTTAGLRLVREGETVVEEFLQSPRDVAERNRRRLFGALVGMSDDEFAEKVQPFIDALEALPEPDRPRRRVHSHALLVFEQ